MAIVHWEGSEPHLQSISVNVDHLLVASVTEVWVCRDEEMAKDALDFSVHDIEFPLFRVKVMGSSADRIEGGFWQITRNYSGLLDEELIGTYKTYKVTTVANREPIEAHPKFISIAGESPEGGGTTDKGALFDENGFVRFLPYLPTKEKNRKAGVTDYLMPIVHYYEDKLVLEEDLQSEVSDLGLIDTPPNSPFRPKYAGRTWLLIKADNSNVAFQTYKLNRCWALSGPRGWDEDVYPI